MTAEDAPLFLQDAYATRATGRVVAHPEGGGVVIEPALFYATSGGQPGDQGTLAWEDRILDIATTRKTNDGPCLMPADPDAVLPAVGAQVEQSIDGALRLRHMRVHTALHLLSVVIPLPVTGGSISATKGRLDFDMPDAPGDKAALEAELNTLIVRDYEVTERWITDAELDADPGLVKTMSVSPPRGAGVVRLVRIGDAETQIDLQPCGGTHVARTGEIGPVRLGKVEKKGKQNRRVYLHLDT